MHECTSVHIMRESKPNPEGPHLELGYKGDQRVEGKIDQVYHAFTWGAHRVDLFAILIRKLCPGLTSGWCSPV